MTTLDDLLGAGAKAAHDQSIIVRDGDNVDIPTVYETEWIVVDSDTQWPPQEGTWVILNNYWQNGVQQQGLYRAGEAYFGNGICLVNNGLSIAENLTYIYKSNFIEWCLEYGITTWHVSMPKNPIVGPDYLDAFINTGFEVEDDSGEYTTIIKASLLPEGKHYQWLMWMKSGFAAGSKPEWVV